MSFAPTTIAERNAQFESVAPLVWKLCRQAAGRFRGIEPEELFSVAAVRVLKQIPRHDPDRSKLATFVFFVTCRILAAHIRDEFQRRRLFVPTDFADTADTAAPPTDPTDQFHAADRRDESEVVRNAVRDLPPPDRELISRRFGISLDGGEEHHDPMTLAELGTVFGGVTGTAIRQREARILRTLAGMLAG